MLLKAVFGLIVLLLVVQQVCSSGQKISHPKLFLTNCKFDVEYRFFCLASSETIIIDLGRSDFQHIDSTNLGIVIKHLPNVANFTMEISIKCQPSARKTVFSYNVSYLSFLTNRTTLPFNSSSEILCKNVFPFTLRTMNEEWWWKDNRPMYNLTMRLKVPKGANFLPSFWTQLRLQFAFHNAHWRLESNGLYLWSWDFIDRLGSAKKLKFPFTDAAMDLMLNMNLSKAKAFDSIQLFDPELTELVRSAPKYVKEFIDIGAMIVFAADKNSYYKYIICLSTGFCRVNHLYIQTLHNVAYIDKETGKLSFSRYGLNKIMNPGVFSENTGARREIFISAGYQRSGSREKGFHLEKFISMKMPKLNFGHLNDGCEIAGSSRQQVTLFAHKIAAGMNKLFCPIICSDFEEPFLFYKGRRPITFRPLFHPFTSKLNGAIGVNIYGTSIVFHYDLTHEDAGEYSCTAGGKKVTFNVSVVAFPSFRAKLLSGQELFGALPAQIFAMEGEGYSVNCTAYFAGIQSVTLTPEFYLRSDSPDGNFFWTKESAQSFIAKANDSGCKVEVSEQSSSHTKTFQLTVRAVFRRSPESIFNHRLVCNASASRADAERLGIPEYSVQSGADVYFVRRPRIGDIRASSSGCCMDVNCSGQCILKVWDNWHTNSTHDGVRLAGTFRTRGGSFEWPNATFDQHMAVAMTTGPLSAVSDQWRSDFLSLTPVFRYYYDVDATKDSTVTVLRGAFSNTADDPHCAVDPLCLYSTGFDPWLSYDMTLANLFPKLSQQPAGSQEGDAK